MKTREELILYLDNKFLIENGSNANVSIPNEIFMNLHKSKEIKDGRQLSFCFSYLILNAFLSKYCAYWDYDGKEFVTKKDMKMILGYSRDNKTINHLIKVNGTLEREGFLIHEADIPVFYDIEKTSRISSDGNNVEMKEWVLSYISDMPIQLKDEFRLQKSKGNPRFEAPMPSFILGVNDYQSTLNDRYSTFTVDYKTLRNLLFEDEEIALIDILTLYFIRHMGYSGRGFEMSYDQMLTKLKMSSSTLGISLKKLEVKKMIDIIDTGFTYEEITDDKGDKTHLFKRNARGYKVLSR